MSTQPIDFSSIGGKLVAPPSGIDFSSIGGKPVQTEAPPSTPPGFWDTLKREGKSMGGTISGIPSAVYHAFSEPPTKDEADKFGGQQEVSGAKRVGLGIYRLGVAPVETAANWYSDAARGKIPNAYEQALSVAPEAMGAGAAGVVAPKLAGAAIDAAPAAAGAVADVAGKAVKSVGPGLKAGVQAVKDIATPENIATAVGGGVGGYAGHLMGEPVGMGLIGAGVGKAFGKALGKNLTAAPAEAAVPAELPAGFQSAQPYQAPVGTADNPMPRSTPEAPPVPAKELPPAFQPAPKTMPPVPGTADLPFKSLFEVPASAANQAIKELGPTAPLADLTERANNIARLGELLNKGLSGKELEPNVPLREQLQASPGALPVKSTTRTAQGLDTAATSSRTSELPQPEPRTPAPPAESTAVSDYRYDPDAKEMHIQWKGNPPRPYVYGEVTPEQAQMFHAAESKGMAAKSIKDNNPYVAKIIDGKRIPVKAAKSEADFISPEEWKAGQEMETQVEGTARR